MWNENRDDVHILGKEPISIRARYETYVRVTYWLENQERRSAYLDKEDLEYLIEFAEEEIRRIENLQGE